MPVLKDPAGETELAEIKVEDSGVEKDDGTELDEIKVEESGVEKDDGTDELE